MLTWNQHMQFDLDDMRADTPCLYVGCCRSLAVTGSIVIRIINPISVVGARR